MVGMVEGDIIELSVAGESIVRKARGEAAGVGEGTMEETWMDHSHVNPYFL